MIAVKRLPSGGLVAAALLLAGGASAAPFGLTIGETITSFEIDAIKPPTGPAGDGGTYSWDGLDGALQADGRVNSVVTDMNILTPSDATHSYDADFLSQSSVFVPPFLIGQGFFGPTGGTDFTIFENGAPVLTGVFINLTVAGTIDTTPGAPLPPISAIGRVAFTGGESSLLTALGGPGGQANVLFNVTVTDFAPSLNILASDLNVWNSSFTYSISGSLTPLSSVPWVPEPSTALLVGFGLLACIGVSRRTTRS